MRTYGIDKFTKGWFIGNFQPTLFKTDEFEAAMKSYSSGDEEEAHYHKIGTEYTVVISGEVEMNGERFGPGTIVVVEPGETAKFRSIKDSVTFVIKVPCVKGDKYMVEGENE